LRPGRTTRGKGSIIGWKGQREDQRILKAPKW
jgi:hypothetical protein